MFYVSKCGVCNNAHIENTNMLYAAELGTEFHTSSAYIWIDSVEKSSWEHIISALRP